MIYYIANARIPTEKAHGIQIMKTCEALASFLPPLARGGIEGEVEVELIIPRRRNPIKTDPYEYYGVESNFKITKLPTIDLVGLIPKIGFWIQSLSFAKFVCLYLLFSAKGGKDRIIYSRDEISLYFLSFFKKNLVWETHRGQRSFIVRRLLRKCMGIITITKAGKELYIKMGVSPEKILVAPDGADLNLFDIRYSKFDIRKQLGLPVDKKIVMYTGNFFEWKGVYVLADAARKFDSSVLFVFIGGSPEEQVKFNDHLSSRQLYVDRHIVVDRANVKMVGQVPHEDIPKYLAAADVLVLPNSGKSDISRYFTSPLKLFEYMASGKPIVASDLPSIREVLTPLASPPHEGGNERGGGNAILVEPDSPQALAEGIKKILSNSELADKISGQAREDVKKYSWDERAKSILEFLKARL